MDTENSTTPPFIIVDEGETCRAGEVCLPALPVVEEEQEQRKDSTPSFSDYLKNLEDEKEFDHSHDQPSFYENFDH